jgi:DNA-binding LacI/PurR family transcriptional regulator
LLCDAFGDPYSLSILRGATDRLLRAGFHVVSFSGGFPQAPLFAGPGGVPRIPEVVEGLIMLSATLRSPDLELGALAASVAGPVVSVGDHLPGFANVGVNDEAAVFQSVAHLVKRHDCQRIAYIAGPEGSVDGERRLAAYRLALEHFGLQPDPDLLVRGNFEASSGREAAMRLYANGSARFDAIVAANDLMAIGAIEALSAAGIGVPETVKVVGFDGIDESPFACGGLTTVGQPVTEQGAAAADLLMRLLAGESVELSPTLISAALLIRHTCGCGSTGHTWRTQAANSPSAQVPRSELALLDGAFRETIRRQLATKRLQRELARLAGLLLGVRDYRELAGGLTDVVRLFDIRRFVLCTYAADPRLARVLLESSGRDVVFRPQAEALPLELVLRAVLAKRANPTSLFIEPLEIADEHFGFLIVEGDLSYGVAQLELRYLVAAALSRIAMMGEMRRLYSAGRRIEKAPPGARDSEPTRERPSASASAAPGELPGVPVVTKP